MTAKHGPAPVAWARKIGERLGALRVVIVVVWPELETDRFGVTTWGRTRADCAAARRWSESGAAGRVARELLDE